MELLTNIIDDESAGPLVLTELCGLFMMIRPSTKSLMEGGALEPDNIIFVKLEARIMEFIKKPTPALINLVLKQIAVRALELIFNPRTINIPRKISHFEIT